MESITVKIGGREIPLWFGMNQFMEIEEEIGNLGTARDMIMKDKKRIRNIVGMIRIMGNGGLKKAGQEADLTDEWLTENMDPHALIGYQVAVIGCLSRDSESEAVKEENEDKERDEVLEEIQAKKAPVNSHTGG